MLKSKSLFTCLSVIALLSIGQKVNAEVKPVLAFLHYPPCFPGERVSPSGLCVPDSKTGVVPVPEPSSPLVDTLAFGGLLGVGLALKRRQKKHKTLSRDKSVV